MANGINIPSFNLSPEMFNILGPALSKGVGGFAEAFIGKEAERQKQRTEMEKFLLELSMKREEKAVDVQAQLAVEKERNKLAKGLEEFKSQKNEALEQMKQSGLFSRQAIGEARKSYNDLLSRLTSIRNNLASGELSQARSNAIIVSAMINSNPSFAATTTSDTFGKLKSSLDKLTGSESSQAMLPAIDALIGETIGQQSALAPALLQNTPLAPMLFPPQAPLPAQVPRETQLPQIDPMINSRLLEELSSGMSPMVGRPPLGGRAPLF